MSCNALVHPAHQDQTDNTGTFSYTLFLIIYRFSHWSFAENLLCARHWGPKDEEGTVPISENTHHGLKPPKEDDMRYSQTPNVKNTELFCSLLTFFQTIFFFAVTYNLWIFSHHFNFAQAQFLIHRSHIFPDPINNGYVCPFSQRYSIISGEQRLNGTNGSVGLSTHLGPSLGPKPHTWT